MLGRWWGGGEEDGQTHQGWNIRGLKFSSVRWLPEAVDAIRRHTQSGATKEGLKRPSKSNSDLRTKDYADGQEPGKYRYGVEVKRANTTGGVAGQDNRHKHTDQPGQQSSLRLGSSCADLGSAWLKGSSAEKAHPPDEIYMYFHKMQLS